MVGSQNFAAPSSLLWVMFSRISVHFALVVHQNVFLLIADGAGRLILISKVCYFQSTIYVLCVYMYMYIYTVCIHFISRE